MRFWPPFWMPFEVILHTFWKPFWSRVSGHLFHGFEVLLASILEVFFADFQGAEGNRNEDAETRKTIEILWFLMVSEGAAARKIVESGDLFWFFGGSVFEPPC